FVPSASQDAQQRVCSDRRATAVTSPPTPQALGLPLADLVRARLPVREPIPEPLRSAPVLLSAPPARSWRTARIRGSLRVRVRWALRSTILRSLRGRARVA